MEEAASSAFKGSLPWVCQTNDVKDDFEDTWDGIKAGTKKGILKDAWGWIKSNF